MSMPAELTMIYPHDKLITTMPFLVQMFFNKEIRNYTITTEFDDNDVDDRYIRCDEFDEEKFWKHNPGEIGQRSFQRNVFYVLHFSHFLTSRGFVKFTVNYEWNDGDDNWTAGSHSFEMTTSPYTIPEANQYGNFSWE